MTAPRRRTAIVNKFSGPRRDGARGGGIRPRTPADLGLGKL